MVTGRDIMQGIDAFTKMNTAMKGNAHDDYYRHMLNRQKCIDANLSKTFKAAQQGLPDPGPDPDCMTANPTGGAATGSYPQGSYGAMSPQDQVSSDVAAGDDSTSAYSAGGMVPHYQGGGEAIDTQQPNASGGPGDPLFDMLNQVDPNAGADIVDGELPQQINRGQPPVMSAELLRTMQTGSPEQKARAATELARRQAETPEPARADPALPPAPVQGPDVPPASNPFTQQRQAIMTGRGAPTPAGPTLDTQPRFDLDQPSAPPAAAAADEERTSAAREFLRGPAGGQYLIQRQIEQLQREKAALEPGIFTGTTARERAEVARKQGEIDGQITQLRQQMRANVPAAAPAAVPAPVPAAVSQGAVAPGAPAVPAVAPATTPAPNAGRPNTGQPPLPMTPGSVAAGIQTNPSMLLPPVNPAGVTGQPAPATGPASPAGRTATGVSPQAAAGAGTSTPGGMSNAPVAAPVPGALSSQTRTAAFNPATEQGIGAVDASGRDIRGGAPQVAQSGDMAGNQQAGLSTNDGTADFAHATLGAHNTAVSAIKSGQATPQQIQQGWGAASPQATNQILQKYGGNGRLTPGTAMVAGMTAVYMRMLEMGDVAGAGRMAFSIVQRANLEAAKNGEAAAAAMQNGHPEVAKQFLVRGLDWTTDGTHVNLSPDRNKLYVTDMHGKVSQVPLDGRVILAASQGLQNGTMLWNMINRHAASMGQRDKDPIGTQLKHMKMRYDIENVQARTARTRSLGARGSGGGSGDFIAGLNAILNPSAPRPQQVNVSVSRDDE